MIRLNYSLYSRGSQPGRRRWRLRAAVAAAREMREAEAEHRAADYLSILSGWRPEEGVPRLHWTSLRGGSFQKVENPWFIDIAVYSYLYNVYRLKKY